MDKKFKEKFLRGSAVTSIGQASSMVFHFASIMILTRVIPRADFGIYALILVINNMFLILSSMGLDVTLVKFISSDSEDDKGSVFTKILLLKLLSLLFFVTIFLIAGKFFLPLFDEKILEFLFFIPTLFFLGSFRDLFFKVLQGLSYFKKYALTQIVSAVSRLLLIIVFLTLEELNLGNLIYLEIFTAGAVLIVLLFLVPFKLIVQREMNDVGFKTILNFSIPIYFNNMFTFLYGRVNLFIIGALMNPVSVAYYDVGAKVSEALKKMLNSFILVFFPNLSNLFSKGDKASAAELINKSLNVISLLLATATLFSFLFRNEIIILLFSEKYAESSLVFSLLMLNLTFRSLANILGYSNLSAGHPKVPMKVNIVCSVVSLSGSFLMIPQFGYVGAAYSLIIMNTLAQALYILYLNKIELKINIFRYTKPVFLLFITVVLYLLLNIDSISIRIIFICFYLILNWIFVTEFKTLLITILGFLRKSKS
ncbi:MAG: flippase [Bacteroidetes bacterium]|nr:flippase [Bacteroidota bacterium]